MDKINILGINISALKRSDIIAKIKIYLNGDEPRYLVTPNPEFILAAGEDEEFFYILNHADLALPDGIGLKFAAWALGVKLDRYTGADLVSDILKLKPLKSPFNIALINWRRGLSNDEEIKKLFEEKYPEARLLIADIDRDQHFPKELTPLIERLSKFQPQILFCTLGAPWQEKWIYHNYKKITGLKLAVGVGGAFDFLTGKIKRAPKFMRLLGLEWFWRLACQPWRLKRICRAVIVFPLKFIKWKFISPRFYRPNVACLLFKKTPDNYKILLVEREDESGHWQLPQGGLDGDNIKNAGKKELREEINTDKFKSVAVLKNLWQYNFIYPPSGVARHRGGEYHQPVGNKGQRQSLYIAEFTGEDSDLKVNFWDHSAWKWIKAEDLINAVHPVRRPSAKIYLDKFNKIIKKYGI